MCIFHRATLVAPIAVIGSIALLALEARPAAAQSAQPFVVIVSEASPVRALSRDQLSKLFLKKSTKLPGGRDAVPVDLDVRSPVRAAFSGAVHQKPVAAINSYWQQQIFAGKEVPPRALSSESAIVAFVRDNPNAVGYVSGSVELGGGVRVVRVER